MRHFLWFFILCAANCPAQTEYSSWQEALKNAKKVQKLSITGEKELDIKKLGKLRNLTELELINCNLSSLPKSIKRLTKLEKINLYGNFLSTLPKEIENLNNLKVLNLSDNKFGLFPSGICKLHKLQSLFISENQVIELPNCISNLTKLNYLNLADNNFEGGIPQNLNLLLSIKTLEVSLIPSMSKAINTLATLPNLTSLTFRCSYNAETLPLEITKLQNLQKIGITNASHIFNWEKTLTFISLLPNLTELYLGENNIKTLPSAIGNLQKIETIILWGNKLTSLPDEFFALPNLKKINLEGNPLSDKDKERLKLAYPHAIIEL